MSNLPKEVKEAMAQAIREEIVRQYRDDERHKGPLSSHDYEEMVAPTQILNAALSALGEAGYAVVPKEPTDAAQSNGFASDQAATGK